MGITDEAMKSMKLSPIRAMAMGFVTALVMSYVLWRFVIIGGAITAGGAVNLAFWLWLGFMVPISAGSFLWEGRPFKLFVLNALHQLVSVALMAIVLTLWQ